MDNNRIFAWFKFTLSDFEKHSIVHYCCLLCLHFAGVFFRKSVQSTKTLKFSLNFADKLKYGEPN